MATQLQELEVDAITRGHLEKGLESLESEFAGVFSGETIERYMAESLERSRAHASRTSCRSSSIASPASAYGPWAR